MRRQSTEPRFTKSVRALIACGPAEILYRVGDATLANAIPADTTTADLLIEARHQADLAGHPYIDETHLRLAAARLAGQYNRWTELRLQLATPWTPRPQSLLRPWGSRCAGRQPQQGELAEAQQAARTREVNRPW
jgi:hypothetical protein